jgi:serine/threonine protein kinase/tetratricopeptide (TPR) repeat protein
MAIICSKCGISNPDASRFCSGCAALLTPSGDGPFSQTKTVRPRRPDSLLGHTFADKYTIVGELGKGGMGVVYKAEDKRLGRAVALKFLPADLTRDPEARKRFVQEAQAASRLDHPNICTIHEISETEDGRTFIVMAFYEGESLKEKIERDPLQVQDAVDIAIQVAAGLSQAHRKGIVHRDIKPANIMFTSEGIAKIVDFGLAKLGGQVALTRAGTVMGTVAYMSPEQAQGEDVDQKTDIWALGVLLYEMVTGKRPFRGDNESAVFYSILKRMPEPVSSLNKDVIPDLDQVINKSLAKDPRRRYESAEEMIADLESIKAGIAPVRAAAAGAATPEVNSVAVINFMNIAADPDFDWLSDGIAETVTVDLKKISSLSVVSREKVLEALKAVAAGETTEEHIIGLGRNLGVRWIVWGGFQKYGKAVRLTAHFTDLTTGNIAGSSKVDGALEDIFRLQDEIIAGLVDTFKLEVSESEFKKIETPETAEVEAYELYVRGRKLLNQMGEKGVPKAIEFFHRAIEIDPGYALAYSGLGSIFMVKYMAQTRLDDLRTGISHLQAAIERDPDLADPHLWLTYAFARDHRFEEAIQSGRRAIQLEPDNSLSHYFLGVAYTLQAAIEYKAENYPDAIRHFKVCTGLQPNFQPAHMNSAWIDLLHGRYTEAEASLSKAVAIEESGKPGIVRFVGALTLMGNLHLRRGQFELALDWYRRSLAILQGVDHVYRDPFQSLTYCGYGAIDLIRGQYDTALDHFKTALNLISRHSRSLGIGYFLIKAYLGLASAFFTLGVNVESKKYYEKAASLFKTKEGYDFNWIWEGCDAQVHYDFAAYFAFLNKKGEALESLRRAVECGWRDVPAITADERFSSLWDDPAFGEVLEGLKKRPPHG